MPPRLKAPDGHKKCTDCKTVKPLDDFHNHKMGSSGKSATCKTCACRKSSTYFKSGKGMEAVRRNMRTPGGRASQLLRSIKFRSKKLGYDFNLDRAWVLDNIAKGCAVTRREFVVTGDDDSGKLRSPYSPSVDRIDTSRGYTKDNCRMVTLVFNTARSDWGDAVVIQLARDILAVDAKAAAR